MSIDIRKKGLTLSFKWNELYLWGISLCMFLFGAWGLYDGLEIGSALAGWKFIFLFTVFVTPSVAALVFFKPRGKEADTPS